MGIELLRSHPFIDVMALGECDSSHAALFGILSQPNSSLKSLVDLPNLAVQIGDEIEVTPRRSISMEEVAEPNYGSYLFEYSEIETIVRAPANLYIEGSRGCWWGSKHHCTFCGIHTSSIAFRQKPAARVFREVQRMVASGNRRIVFSDTILSLDHLRDLVPMIADLNEKNGGTIELYLDVKTNMKFEELERLKSAGAHVIQAGIEFFADNTLRSMKKGNSAFQQIMFLRNCSELGIFVYYGILTHTPFEICSDYEECLYYVERIKHLSPPSGIYPTEMDRYSPSFQRWEEQGFPAPKPAEYYKLMFPDGGIDLSRFAYHFDCVHPSTMAADVDEARERLRSEVLGRWIPRYAPNRFYYEETGSTVDIYRCDEEGSRCLYDSVSGLDARVFLATRRPQSFDRLAEWFPELSPSELNSIIGRFVDRGVWIKHFRDHFFLLIVPKKNRGSAKFASPYRRTIQVG